MHFTIETTYDQHVMKVMAWALRKTLGRRKRVVRQILGWLGVVVAAAILLLVFVLDQLEFTLSTMVILLAGLTVFIALLREDELNGWSAAKKITDNIRKSTTTFDDEGYTVSTRAAQSRWTYDRILLACETTDYFVFFFTKKHGQILDKNGFTVGTPDAFRAFIAEKTGKPVEYIK